MPVNLREKYGKRYRIDYERFQDGTPVNVLDPWLMQLRSPIGHVYVHSDTHLGFATNSRKRQLFHVPDLTLVQDGDDGQNFIFPEGKLPDLAGLLKLYVRRQLTEEEKARLAVVSAPYRFQSRQSRPPQGQENASGKELVSE